MNTLTDIQTLLREGEAEQLQEAVKEMLEAGGSPQEILNDGLLPAMNAVGEDFKEHAIFIPEVMIASRAMNAALATLRPLIADVGGGKGTAVIGTVKGDVHDIGKNIVKTMLEGRGLHVVDLGVDVSAEQFVEAAQGNDADLVCCSALLTTSMGEMGRVTALVKEAGLACKVMVGGAVVSQAFCDKIGADCYTPDAASAADAAAALCGR